MVTQEPCLYLLLGEDALAKDAKIKSLKDEFLPPQLENFNLDVLYGRELKLKDLQERLLALPIKAKKRLLLIRDAGSLRQELKDFLLKYSRKPHPWLVLVLDFPFSGSRDEFILSLSRQARVLRFRQTLRPDTFVLARLINSARSDAALKVLHQLLEEGKKPEWLLGGLRYATERDIPDSAQKTKRLKLLLNCDLEMKTGRLKSAFALERLVVSLCRASQRPG
jgi:DNA polymerase III delta subunit